MVKILDASALVAYLWKQSGYEKVQDFLTKATDGEKRLLMTTVNFWGAIIFFFAIMVQRTPIRF